MFMILLLLLSLLLLLLLNAIEFSLGGSSRYTSTDKTRNLVRWRKTQNRTLQLLHQPLSAVLSFLLIYLLCPSLEHEIFSKCTYLFQDRLLQFALDVFCFDWLQSQYTLEQR